MGEPSSIRFRGTDGAFVTAVPKTGTWEKNYLWVKGPQAVRLGLTYGDGGEGRTGRPTHRPTWEMGRGAIRWDR